MQIEVLGERYQLQDPIGRGGMATIYRGRDLRMDRVVAIKVLREVYSTDPKFVTRFQREAKAASALQHPNIVQVYDYGQTEGNYYIVMELVEGTDLRRYLRSRGLLDVERAIIIAHDVALGLGAAHRRGIVHRDVKPQNVLVGRDGTIKLTDFGIASVYKDINAERLTTTGMTLGTVQYYAPEQAQGEIVNPAADVYALGIVMYEMLTGRTPFDGDTPVAVAMQHIQDIPLPPSQLNPNIPPALEDIILRCLEKIPEMRYRDGSTLARALEALGESELNESLPSTITPPGMTPAGTYNALVPDGRHSDPLILANGGSENGGRYANTSSPNNIAAAATYASPGMSGNIDEQFAAQGGYGSLAPEFSSTRPFKRGAIAGRGNESRVASVVTAIILLATLLLLGVSVYLAAVLGFIPFLKLGPAPITAPIEVPVPGLINLSLQDAQARAASAGFVLRVHNNLTSGYVVSQSPQPPAQATRGSTILVDLQTQLTVPDGLVGNTLSGAIAILRSQGIQYAIKTAGTDDSKPANYVTKTSPESGARLDKGQYVILYVVNMTSGTPTVTPNLSPSPVATATATPTPKRSPTPTPTTIPPTATPTDTATPTPKGSPVP